MKHLLVLHKFELNREILKNKIKERLNDAKFYEDNGLILETSKDIDEILYFEEINQILPLYKDWQKLNFKTFKNNFENLNIKSYFIKVKFLSKIPISGKSIKSRAVLNNTKATF